MVYYIKRKAVRLEAFTTSVLLVAIAETGDKTQLLAFALAAQFRRPYPVIAGIFVATLLNHAFAAAIGTWLANLIAPPVATLIIGVSFIGFGLWTLRPDTLDSTPRIFASGIFITTLVAFFLAEMGDKTQFATIALAARYPDGFLSVLSGTTLGMMIANVPAVWVGEILAQHINMQRVRWLAAALFILTGIGSLTASPLLLWLPG